MCSIDALDMFDFWSWFEAEAKPKLGKRAETFAQMFRYLDSFERPVHIIETGCMRDPNAWAGDGCSTLMFDRYIQGTDGSLHSCDIDQDAVKLCWSMVGDQSQSCISCEDSVDYLRGMASYQKPWCDLLYLDSYDLDPIKPLLSEIHHINELLAALPLLRPDTLVVVDDSPSHVALGRLRVTGKGKLVAEYANEVGAKLMFAGYQVGWTGMVK